MPRRKRPSPARKAFRAFLLVVLLLLAASGFLLLYPFGPHSETFIDIPAHTSSPGIAAALEHGGAVRNRWVFLLLHEVEGGTLKAGEYRFDHPASMLEVYRRVRRGDVYTVAVSIPEGFNVFDIAGAVEGVGLAPASSFLAAAKADVGLVRHWDPQAPSLEGYLFPDTYRFSRHATPAVMLAAMTHRFEQMALRLGITPAQAHRTVTLASLVEREVHLDAERPVVAGVFENRLKAGMPLQTDPAVVYASLLRGTWTGVIHQSELHSDSPYNTYVQKGLPPGPICSPGVAALKAALHPARTEFLYFVANSDGTTQFARSLQEHNGNVLAYRATQSRPH